VHQLAARHGQVGFCRVKLPVGVREQLSVASEHRPLVEQSSLPDPLVHAADRLPRLGPDRPSLRARRVPAAGADRATRALCGSSRSAWLRMTPQRLFSLAELAWQDVPPSS